MTKIEIFLNKHHLIDKYKAKLTGDEWEMHSPFDDELCKKKKCFYLNNATGMWVCHRSGESGVNLKQLEFRMGVTELKEPTRSHIFIPEGDVIKWQEALNIKYDALTYLTTVRCLTRGTIKQFKLGWRMKAGRPVIVIPYFDANGACVGAKYDFYIRDESGKYEKYIKEKGSKTQMFNLNRLDKGAALYLTEGEYDAMSLWQYGYTNVGSVPNGAQGIGEWVDEIAPVPIIFLCLDNDEAGVEGATKFAERVGRSKCSRVYPRLNDFNDYLQHGLSKGDVKTVMDLAEPMFKAPITALSEYTEEAYRVLDNPEAANGVSTGWPSIDAILGGIRMGEVTAASGYTSDGKTTFALALVSNLIKESGIKSLIISPEMREQYLLMRLAANYFDRAITTYDEIDEYVARYGDTIYISKVFDQWTYKSETSLISQTFDVIEHAIKNQGVQFFVLDHLRLFTNPLVRGDNERLLIDEFLQRCVHCAVSNGVHIWLIVQPKHIDEATLLRCKKCFKPVRKKITRSDLKGSSSIAQDSSNVILIHRYLSTYCNCVLNFDDSTVEIEVAKNRQLGTEGTIPLLFNKDSKSNYSEIE